MAHLDAGAPSFEDGDRITLRVSTGLRAGTAVTFNGSGVLIQADGTNGFAGVLGIGTEDNTDVQKTAVQVQGIPAAIVQGTVTAGQKLEVAGNGEFQGVTDGSGNAVMAGPAELKALPSEDPDVTEVMLP